MNPSIGKNVNLTHSMTSQRNYKVITVHPEADTLSTV